MESVLSIIEKKYDGLAESTWILTTSVRLAYDQSSMPYARGN